NTPCDSWGGVKCKNGHVTELDLHNKRLSNFPESIEQLSQLEKLNLSNNELSGSIPESIGNLRQLERLYLNNNQLSSSIPESIGNLGQLRHLRLHENALCGNVPLSFMNFHALGRNELSLKGNHLTASNQFLINWLNRVDNGWETSQTICPQKVLLMTLVILLLLGIGIGTVIAIRKTSMTPKQLFIVFFQKTFSILVVSVPKLLGIFMILLGILLILVMIQVVTTKTPSASWSFSVIGLLLVFYGSHFFAKAKNTRLPVKIFLSLLGAFFLLIGILYIIIGIISLLSLVGASLYIALYIEAISGGLTAIFFCIIGHFLIKYGYKITKGNTENKQGV
ncbi:MAG: hypothetical protein VSS75_025690, partial [Candidatus Parabeggiatoa sp.]|nr:hypothetical protein [Candidatus Parabeggiatoa sp.]